jgi:hypothetical protein
VLTVKPAALVSIAVTPANPSITKGATQQFTATGTFSDNSTQALPSVTWASGTPSVATINTSGLATGVIAGTSTVSATSGVITGSTVLTVTPATLVSIAVTPANPSITKGATQQFTATGTFSDNSTQALSSVTWASAMPSVATINAAGLASGVSAGTSTISATSGAISGSTVLTVAPATLVSIAIGAPNASLASGASEQFTAMGTYSDASTSNITTQVSWSSATASVATINATGLVTGVNVGITNITAALGLVTSTAFQLTVIAGKPAIFGAVLDQASTGGSFYIDLQLKNTGTGAASNIQLARLTLRTLTGTGTVTYDAVQSPQLPIQIPSLAAGASATVRLFFIVPATVTRFSVTENGSLQDGLGNLLNWSSGQSIFH